MPYPSGMPPLEHPQPIHQNRPALSNIEMHNFLTTPQSATPSPYPRPLNIPRKPPPQKTPYAGPVEAPHGLLGINHTGNNAHASSKYSLTGVSPMLNSSSYADTVGALRTVSPMSSKSHRQFDIELGDRQRSAEGNPWATTPVKRGDSRRVY